LGLGGRKKNISARRAGYNSPRLLSILTP
jgi:hypothetical protein